MACLCGGGVAPRHASARVLLPCELPVDPLPRRCCCGATHVAAQSCDSEYVANTDNALLKFKFAHLNSVDFKLQVQGPHHHPVRVCARVEGEGGDGCASGPLRTSTAWTSSCRSRGPTTTRCVCVRAWRGRVGTGVPQDHCAPQQRGLQAAGPGAPPPPGACVCARGGGGWGRVCLRTTAHLNSVDFKLQVQGPHHHPVRVCARVEGEGGDGCASGPLRTSTAWTSSCRSRGPTTTRCARASVLILGGALLRGLCGVRGVGRVRLINARAILLPSRQLA